MTESADRAVRPPSYRPHFTGRAAVLAVVLCAIALSLAYPVREYIAQRRQIDQLQERSAQIELNLKRLEAKQKQLSSKAYIEQQARDRLHMCLPTQMCYVVIGPASGAKKASAQRAELPWYARMWSSVQQADTVSSGRDQADAGKAGTGKAASTPGKRPPAKARRV